MATATSRRNQWSGRLSGMHLQDGNAAVISSAFPYAVDFSTNTRLDSTWEIRVDVFKQNLNIWLGMCLKRESTRWRSADSTPNDVLGIVGPIGSFRLLCDVIRTKSLVTWCIILPKLFTKTFLIYNAMLYIYLEVFLNLYHLRSQIH